MEEVVKFVQDGKENGMTVLIERATIESKNKSSSRF